MDGATARRQAGSSPVRTARSQSQNWLLLYYPIPASGRPNLSNPLSLPRHPPFRGNADSGFASIGRLRCFDILRMSR